MVKLTSAIMRINGDSRQRDPHTESGSDGCIVIRSAIRTKGRSANAKTALPILDDKSNISNSRSAPDPIRSAVAAAGAATAATSHIALKARSRASEKSNVAA